MVRVLIQEIVTHPIFLKIRRQTRLVRTLGSDQMLTQNLVTDSRPLCARSDHSTACKRLKVEDRTEAYTLDQGLLRLIPK